MFTVYTISPIVSCFRGFGWSGRSQVGRASYKQQQSSSFLKFQTPRSICHCNGTRLLLNSAFSGVTLSGFRPEGNCFGLSVQAPVWRGEDVCDSERLKDEGSPDEEMGPSSRPTPSDSDLVNILEIIQGKGNWRYQKVKDLKQLRLKLDPSLVLKVLTHEEVIPSVAWKFFVWTKKQMGYKHTSETYNAMLATLCESRKFTSIFFVLEDMHEEGASLTTETCMKMAKTFGSAGLVERALHALNHMARLGSPPTARQYNSLVSALLKGHHYYKAYIAYTEMVRAGCEADSYTFRLLIRELDRADKVDLACQLFNDMVLRECEPDAETSSILIGVLCKAGRVDDAVSLFEKMKQKGIRPNTSRYSTLIHYLGKDNKVDQALELFDELRENGCLPDKDTLSTLVDLLRSEGRDEDADRCYEYTRIREVPKEESDECGC